MLRAEVCVVQMNLFGAEEAADVDGTALPEKAMARRRRIRVTPALVLPPEEAGAAGSVAEAAATGMPGAFARGATRRLLQWVREKGCGSDAHFQKPPARPLAEAREGGD